jgi:ADP-ribosylglycohydrolase
LLARSGLPRVAIRQRIAEQFGYDLAPERALARGGFDISAAGTVPPALTAALEADSWEGAVRTAVCLGGDTDTLACIAGAVAEAMHGLPADIANRARGYLTDDLRAVLERFEAAIRACI